MNNLYKKLTEAVDYNAEILGFEDGVKLETIDNESLMSVLDDAYNYNMEWYKDLQVYKERKKKQLTELKAKSEAELNAKVESGEITSEEAEKILNRRLRRAAEEFEWPIHLVLNILVVGAPGGGKTSMIRKWCKNNDVGCVLKTGAQITKGVIGGYPTTGPSKKDPNKEKVLFLPTEFFDDLDDDLHDVNILFIDELNRSETEAEGDILTLVQDHTIPDRTEDGEEIGQHLFKRLLFTIAAMNPPSSDSTVEPIGQAMADRFTVYIWNSNKEEFGEYIKDELNNIIDLHSNKGGDFDFSDPNVALESKYRVMKAENLKRIAAAICDPKSPFKFYDPEAKKNSNGTPTENFSTKDPNDMHTINARTLTTALMSCDGHTGLSGKTGVGNYPKKSFLWEFDRTCVTGPSGKAKCLIMEDILKPLEDEINMERLVKKEPDSIPVDKIYKVWRNKRM